MPDSRIDESECERIFGRLRTIATSLGVRDIELMVAAGQQTLTRFANSRISQQMSEDSRFLSVRTQWEGRTARATTNRLDDDSLRRVVEQAAALTRALPSKPDLLPMAQGQTIRSVERYDDATARSDSGAIAIADAIAQANSYGQTVAGIYSAEHHFEGIWNSAGVRASHRQTLAQFSITSMAGDSSGWAKASSVKCKDLNTAHLTRIACQKAKASADPIELEPGAYDVILEPSATLDLVGQMFGDFSATALEDQRSFLNERMGTKLFGDNIQIRDNVYHPLQAGAPFDGEGVPRRALELVKDGVPTEVPYSRASAQRAGKAPTGHGFPLPNEIGEAPANIVIEGGTTSLEQMIADTKRGILVTRFWYIREVDPYEKIMTGMTRDGTFLIEDGELVRGVRNFRFNQSLIAMLNNVEALSPAVRSSGEETFDFVAPAMKVRDFQFSEVTKF